MSGRFQFAMDLMKETAEFVNPVILRAYDEFEESLRDYVKYLPSIRCGADRRHPQLRPLLVRLGYEVGRSDYQKIIPLCAAMEILNDSTYAIDDVLDNTDLRSKEPTIHRKYDSDRAIIAGILLREIAEAKIFDCNLLTSEQQTAIIRATNELHKTVYVGQHMDLELNTTKPVSVSRYIDRSYKITGAFIENCIIIGAIAAGCSNETKQVLSSYGKAYGIAVQLRNDLMDYVLIEPFAPESSGFKGISHVDFREGKQTLPVISALANLSHARKEQLIELLGKKSLSESQFASVNALISEGNGFEATEQEIESYAQKAKDVLVPLKECMSKKAFIELAEITNNVHNWKFV